MLITTSKLVYFIDKKSIHSYTFTLIGRCIHFSGTLFMKFMKNFYKCSSLFPKRVVTRLLHRLISKVIKQVLKNVWAHQPYRCSPGKGNRSRLPFQKPCQLHLLSAAAAIPMVGLLCSTTDLQRDTHRPQFQI